MTAAREAATALPQGHSGVVKPLHAVVIVSANVACVRVLTPSSP
jgi:hypothetical protein